MSSHKRGGWITPPASLCFGSRDARPRFGSTWREPSSIRSSFLPSPSLSTRCRTRRYSACSTRTRSRSSASSSSWCRSATCRCLCASCSLALPSFETPSLTMIRWWRDLTLSPPHVNRLSLLRFRDSGNSRTGNVQFELAEVGVTRLDYPPTPPLDPLADLTHCHSAGRANRDRSLDRDLYRLAHHGASDNNPTCHNQTPTSKPLLWESGHPHGGGSHG